ncbi:hypothetical protein [Streptomyces sp. NPDC001450]
MVITGEGTLTALYALFESVWATATPLSALPEPDERGLTPQESQALKFLYEGHTDETIPSGSASLRAPHAGSPTP